MRADGVSAVRIASLAGVLLVFANVASGENAATPVDWARAERVDVRMLEYEFVLTSCDFAMTFLTGCI